MLEKKKILPLAEAERALWSTKGVFASRLVLKMEIPVTGVYKSLALGRLAQRRHRVGLAEREVSVWPERSGPEWQGDRRRLLGCVGPMTPHSINFTGFGSQ